MRVISVRIGGQQVPVRYADPEDPANEGLTGSFDRDQGIEIKRRMDQGTKALTLVHECLHAIWQINRLPKSLTEEELCESLEGPLLGFLKDNPELICGLSAGDPLTFAPAPRE